MAGTRTPRGAARTAIGPLPTHSIDVLQIRRTHIYPLSAFRKLPGGDKEDLNERKALARPDPWEAMLAGLDLFLDICLEPEVQRIALLDAPSVLGWETWREIESRYGLGLIRLGLQGLMEAGIAERQPLDPLAHAMLGTLYEAGLYVARAADVEAARSEMGFVLRRMLDGVREDRR